MSRLPSPGQDAGSWGDILNDYLTQAHKPDGTLKDNSVGAAQLKTDAVTTTQIADNSITTATVADGAITAAKLGNDVVMGGTPADGSITTAKIANDAVTNAKVDSATRTSLAKADSASQPGHIHAIADVTNLQTTLDGKQPAGSYVNTTRTVNGHALSSDVTVTAGDVGAVPITRTVNGKQLNVNVSLTASDVGAATLAQGAKADSAVQPGSLASVATTGSFADLTDAPNFGDAAMRNVGVSAGTVAAGDDSRIVNAVPSSRTVNAKPLSSDIILNAADVSAVPTTRTINTKPLSADITLNAADVGAATAAQGTLAGTAVQPGQVILTNKKIIGVSYFAVSSRSFPSLIRPPESTRGRIIIRNMGTNNVNVVVANHTSANYNSPGWTGSIAVGAGKEFVSDNAMSDFFIGPDADGTLIKVKVYGEVNF